MLNKDESTPIEINMVLVDELMRFRAGAHALAVKIAEMQEVEDHLSLTWFRSNHLRHLREAFALVVGCRQDDPAFAVILRNFIEAKPGKRKVGK